MLSYFDFCLTEDFFPNTLQYTKIKLLTYTQINHEQYTFNKFYSN